MRSVFRVHSTATGYTDNGSIEQALEPSTGLTGTAAKAHQAECRCSETDKKVSTNRRAGAPLTPRGLLK